MGMPCHKKPVFKVSNWVTLVRLKPFYQLQSLAGTIGSDKDSLCT